MEAVAAASSIAGIVAVAGQALNGVIKLRGFFKDCASSSKTIDRFLRDLNSLIQTLEDVKCIVTSLEVTTPGSFDSKTILSSLQIQLEDCSKDVYDWIHIASEQHPKFAAGSKATFKKFLVATNKESIEGIFKEIAGHKGNIRLKLSIIGRYLDVEQASRLQTLDTKLKEVTVNASNNHDITTDALKRLEERLSTGGEDPSGTPSLQSLASQISRIENILSRNGSQRSFAGSAAGSSMGSQKYSPALQRGGSYSESNGSSIGSHERIRDIAVDAFNFQKRKATKRSSDVDQQNGQARSAKTFGGATKLTILEDFISEQLETMRIAEPKPESRQQQRQSQDDAISDQIKAATVTKPKTESRQSKQHQRPDDAALLQLQYQSTRTTTTLMQSYRMLLDISDENCPKALLEYIDLVQCFRTISMHAKLLSSVHDTECGETIETLRSTDEYLQVLMQLENIKECIEMARHLCWELGYNLEQVDQIIDAGYPQHRLGRDISRIQNDKSTRVGQVALLALQKRLERVKAQRSWLRKQDRINSWLLQNLADSDENASLHRSFLPYPEISDEEWARMVLKFWPIDGAVVKREEGERREKNVESSRDAVDSGRLCHSVRVLLELEMLEDMSQITGALSISAFSDGFGIANRVLELERLGKSLNQHVLGSIPKSGFKTEVLADDDDLAA